MSRVEIYTTGYCPFCHRAKAILEEYGVDFEEYDVTTDREGRQTMIERSEGRRTVPQIFINGKGIGGCDDLTALARSGQLEGLLAAG